MGYPSRILLVGGGNMGQALLRGWRAKGIDPNRLHVVETDAGRRRELAELQCRVYASMEEVDDQLHPEVTVLAVKPADAAGLLTLLAAVWPESLLLSVLAGKTLAFYTDKLGGARSVVRVMPNISAIVGKGVSVCVATDTVDDEHRAMAEKLMAAVGRVWWVEEESQMDAVTALSGSGPAYFFYFMECLVDAAVQHGLPVDLATALAIETGLGACSLAASSQTPLAGLRQQVTSPGGTTAAALSRLMKEEAFSKQIRSAFQAAYEQSHKLDHS